LGFWDNHARRKRVKEAIHVKALPELDAPASGQVMTGMPAERVVETGRACHNCLHFQRGDVPTQRFIAQFGVPPGTTLPNLARADMQDPVFHRAIVAYAAKHNVTFERATDVMVDARAAERKRDWSLGVQVGLGITQGFLGVCAVENKWDYDAKAAGWAPAQYVAQGFRCGTSSGVPCHWTGATGSSMATDGKPLDKHFDEIYDDLGDKK
jgi:hypothetical protein